MDRILLLITLLLAGPSQAQTLAWEHVGDRPLNVERPSIAPDGMMWSAGGSRLRRLPPPYGPAQAWTELRFDPNDPVLALGQDTLISYNGGLVRSVDGGAAFRSVVDGGVGRIGHYFEVPAGTPGAGALLAGELAPGRWAGYSLDRGASWHLSSFPPLNSEGPRAFRFAVVTAGPHAGRVVGAGDWGLATSDDCGVSFRRVPGRYEYFRFVSSAIATLRGAAPTGGDRLVAAIIDPTRPGVISRVLVSDDGAETWRETFGLTGDPNAAATEVVDLGGGRAVIAMNGGHVWQTNDAGETWRITGVVPGSLIDQGPEPTSNARVLWALLGPDRRLYVGGRRLGGRNPGWAFRTVEPFAVAGESDPSEAPPLGLSVRPNPAGGRVEVVLTLAEASTVRVVVVDALGRDVAVVVDGPVAAGERVVGVETASWPAGVYVVRATAGTQTATARLVVAR